MPATTLTEIGSYSDEKGNKVLGAPKVSINSKIIFGGSNCKVEFDDGVNLNGVFFNFTCDEGYIKIGAGSHFKGSVTLGLGCGLIIGSGLSITGPCRIEAAERTSITIGDDCMFASLVQIRTDDSHPIFDIDTKRRVNESGSIHIGRRVWLGYEAVLLSGAEIGDGSVVGLRSVVTSRMPSNCVCVGMPAKVVRTGVSWERSNLKTKPPYEFKNPSEPIQDFRGY